jgi:hypothetical protein
MFTEKDLDVYAFLKTLVDTKAVKTSTDAEVLLRKTFEHINHFNSYTYVMRFFRYREKIESSLAERTADPQNVQTCQTQGNKQECCSA